MVTLFHLRNWAEDLICDFGTFLRFKLLFDTEAHFKNSHSLKRTLWLSGNLVLSVLNIIPVVITKPDEFLSKKQQFRTTHVLKQQLRDTT